MREDHPENSLLSGSISLSPADCMASIPLFKKVIINLTNIIFVKLVFTWWVSTSCRPPPLLRRAGSVFPTHCVRLSFFSSLIISANSLPLELSNIRVVVIFCTISAGQYIGTELLQKHQRVPAAGRSWRPRAPLHFCRSRGCSSRSCRRSLYLVGHRLRVIDRFSRRCD